MRKSKPLKLPSDPARAEGFAGRQLAFGQQLLVGFEVVRAPGWARPSPQGRSLLLQLLKLRLHLIRRLAHLLLGLLAGVVPESGWEASCSGTVLAVRFSGRLRQRTVPGMAQAVIELGRRSRLKIGEIRGTGEARD